MDFSSETLLAYWFTNSTNRQSCGVTLWGLPFPLCRRPVPLCRGTELYRLGSEGQSQHRPHINCFQILYWVYFAFPLRESPWSHKTVQIRGCESVYCEWKYVTHVINILFNICLNDMMTLKKTYLLWVSRCIYCAFSRIIFSIIPYVPLHVKYIFRWLKMIHKTKLRIKIRAADGKNKSGDMRKTQRFHRGIKSVP